jgi:hypothetical protein
MDENIYYYTIPTSQDVEFEAIKSEMQFRHTPISTYKEPFYIKHLIIIYLFLSLIYLYLVYKMNIYFKIFCIIYLIISLLLFYILYKIK